MYKKPAEYWRENKNWSSLIGKLGKVIVTTQVSVTSPELQKFLPYSFAIIEVDGIKHELMGEKGVVLKTGDKVRLTLRKIAITDKNSLISYGIKAIRLK